MAEQIPVESRVADLVVSRASIHEWRDAQAGCAECHRVLRRRTGVRRRCLGRKREGVPLWPDEA